jgi:hypothetical protein
MADPARQEPHIGRYDDPTRDIRLPPAAGSPPPAVRPERSSYTARQQPVPAEVPPPHPPRTETAAAPTADLGKAAPRRPLDVLADEPTDQLVKPGGPPRERTLEFAHGQAAPVRPPVSPAPAVPAPKAGRRWPWLLMALLPIIVIVGSGIWLFILLSHA